MAPKTFFEHYRISRDYDGSPMEIGRTGPAIHYKASDLRSGEPVMLTSIPVASIDPQARERFEEKARGALQLDHINIEKVIAFGTELDQFAFISEFPKGETLEAWVAGQSPMAVDAVLRVALQVASALSAASFYGLNHPGIQPSNLMIIPGQTAEGGWPLIKVTNFSVACLPVEPAVRAADGAISEFASPEQVQSGKVDFRSEIYSLGATMCFLLTGAFDSAEPGSLQTKRFTRPLRNLIAPMLRQNPDDRPQDPTLFAQEVRSCLQRVERRQGLAQKLGIPFVPVMARAPKKPVLATPPEETAAAVAETKPQESFLRRAWPVAALLIALALIAAAFLPAPVSMILHRNHDAEAIGVPVGVPDSSPVATAPNSLPVKAFATAPTPAPSAAINGAIVQSSPVIANQAVTSPAAQAAQTSSPAIALQPADPSTEIAANARTPGPQPPADAPGNAGSPLAAGPQTVWDRASGTQRGIQIQKQDAANEADSSNSGQAAAGTSNNSGAEANTESHSTANAGAPNTSHPAGGGPARSRAWQAPADDSGPGASRSYDGTVRARYIGMTPDGNLILRLPSGRTIVVPRNAARLTVPPRHRVMTDPRFYYPPPPYGPGY